VIRVRAPKRRLLTPPTVATATVTIRKWQASAGSTWLTRKWRSIRVPPWLFILHNISVIYASVSYYLVSEEGLSTLCLELKLGSGSL
jgi:hypothetical protein